MRIAVEEAHRIGLKVAIHAGGDARKAILAGADSIEHGDRLSDELLQLMKERGTVLVPRAMPYEHWAVAGFGDPNAAAEDSLSVLRRAHAIGVNMVFGADVVHDLPEKTRADMILDYVDVWDAAGIPRAKILKSMTTDAAELLGIQKERGAIAPGFAADIIAMPESPLESIRALRKVNFVMKNGKLVKQTKISEKREATPADID
jgi:imidazolonepropionase-like amidohydrolase